MKATKKRYLLILLAVIAGAFLLVLPGTALAAYETPTHLVIPAVDQGGRGWDLDTGSMSEGTGTLGTDIVMTDGTVFLSISQAGEFIMNQEWWLLQGWMSPVSYYFFGDPATGTPTSSFSSITYADLAGLTWQDGPDPWGGFLPAWSDLPPLAMCPFVVRTAEGNYFRLQCDSIGNSPSWPFYSDWVWDVQRLVPSDPPTLLNDLKDFIAAPTSGVDPVIGGALTAKVNAALAALDRGKTKTALNNLNALLNQVKAQTGKKITQQAADEINSQVNAIIAAINQP
jgi:hypothetical protein